MDSLELLTVQEVAQLLRINSRTVYRRVKENSLPFFRTGGTTGSIRFPKSKILDLINGRPDSNST